MTVLIAGAGIAGLTLGLTLHQIGVPFQIFEAADEIKPLGVGINLQPNAVRELTETGLADDLDAIGVRTRQYGFYSKHGLPIWEEPRGLEAGYNWPQYSVHRGRLQMMLLAALTRRAGQEVVRTGAHVLRYEQDAEGVDLHLSSGEAVRGTALIACDGIHSAVRAQMFPQEGAPIWSGAVLWRGVARSQPFFGGAAMALAGHDWQRVVAYPISDVGTDGLVDMNFIVEKRFDPTQGWRRDDWNRAVDPAEILPDFADWVFDWLDVPDLLRRAEAVFEYPMVDRDPLEGWQDGRVTLMGDAAHPTYPVGSSGASQAIVDARVLGGQFQLRGVCPLALEAYESILLDRTNRITLANRGKGPDAIMQQVEDLCGGRFETIEDVIPRSDLAAHAAQYKSLAGTLVTELNARKPLVVPA